MDVQLPDGTVLTGVPEGTTQEQIIAKVRRFDPAMARQMLEATRYTMATDVEVPTGIDAAMIGAGRAVERLGRGAQDIFARMTGDEATREDIAAAEQESATLYEPVREQYPVASAVGESLPAFAVPMGAVGQVAGRGLQAARASRAANLARGAVGDAALTGAALGALDTESSALGGAAGGAVGGLLGAGVGRALRPVVNRLGPAREAAAGEVADLGLQLTPGLSTDAPGLLRAEASLRSHPWSAGLFRGIDEANQTQVNRIAAESIGETAGEVTDEVLGRAANRIGDAFETVADEPVIGLGDEFVDAIARVEQDFGEAWTEAPAARRAIDKALELASRGQITGREALDATQRLGKDSRRLWKGANADPLAAEALDGIKGALDDAITRSVSPEKAAALSEARGQWRNLLLLERPGVVKSPAVGDVSLPSLANAARQQRGTAFTRGRETDELSRLARVGRAFPQAVGDSGTASRLALPLLAAGGGLALDDIQQGELGQATMQAALPALAMYGLGRGYTSPAMGRYLSRGLLPLTESGRRMLTGAGARLGAGGGLLPYQNR